MAVICIPFSMVAPGRSRLGPILPAPTRIATRYRAIVIGSNATTRPALQPGHVENSLETRLASRYQRCGASQEPRPGENEGMNQRSGAEAFVRLLELHGVDHIFGLC